MSPNLKSYFMPRIVALAQASARIHDDDTRDGGIYSIASTHRFMEMLNEPQFQTYAKEGKIEINPSPLKR